MIHSNPSWWQVFKSVAASAFGVQTEANRQQDFRSRSFWPYLITGVVFVTAFVLVLVFVVKLILAGS
ncbi:hypothetical protein HMF8227_02745 [Saliniradius amylolyticus]|uniref:DUF2970 domain-containing protein n=1 Tax=Saliniradius amylolyticus TaxID=2183582 RepID=A0A2S2E6B1_9ALTE|nr:DUF2970 domain-containing protein [Saliniradius amylolyticus]AWL13196.1 hypothetical protein HMF8227_02745 [Saliniradius amylolyticus]